MNTKIIVSLLGALFYVSAAFADTRLTPEPAMVGQWTGVAEIVVSWTKQRSLALDLVIRADGTVTGRIGDATLTNGHLATNRNWLGKKLNLATDYIIVGDLAGAIIAAEQIRREHIKVPLNWSEGIFRGGVHTSGSHFGGREKMILSASRLQLHRKETTP